MFAVIATAAGIATILGLAWMVYTYYRPRTQQPDQPIVVQLAELRLSQCLPANKVNDAVVFMDWIQKHHNEYIHSYPSFIAIRPYLTILQQEGFIDRSDVSNMDGDVFELTAQGQKALIASGVQLV
jgi:hypothetical protein